MMFQAWERADPGRAERAAARRAAYLAKNMIPVDHPPTTSTSEGEATEGGASVKTGTDEKDPPAVEVPPEPTAAR